MKNAFPILVFVLFLTAGCNSENAEKAAQSYLSETLKDFKDGLPNELKMIDSLLLDSGAIKRKIAATTNLDSLEKYNKLLKDARILLTKDLSTLDSISPKIKLDMELAE